MSFSQNRYEYWHEKRGKYERKRKRKLKLKVEINSNWGEIKAKRVREGNVVTAGKRNMVFLGEESKIVFGQL